jgi:hypothetical protein
MFPPRHPRPPTRRKRSFFARGRVLLACLSALSPAGAQSLDKPAASAGPTHVFEEWSLLLLDGKRCGFESTVTTSTGSGAARRYRTVDQQEFVIKRLNQDVKTIETSDITEDAEGGVLAFQERTAGTGSDIESTGRREGDTMVVSSRGQTARYKIPRLSALGPEAVRRLSDALPLETGQTFSFSTFESDYPQEPVLENGIILGRDTRTVLGAARKLWKISSSTSLMAGLESTSWVDDHGNDVESILAIPGVGRLDQVVTTRADCMKQPEGAEIFANSLIRPRHALPAPSQQARAWYRITSGDPRQVLFLWNQDEQTVIASRPGSIDVMVTAPTITPAEATWQLPHADTPELHPYLQASSYLEADAPEIRKLARQAVGDEKNPVLAAHRIQEFVRAYITKKDLNIGFASAEETARSREGDCTEHAVLCAALGRAVGLPTRCVIGFGYIPPGVDEPAVANTVDHDTGLFGFHMWAEAWIAPHRWVAMDAALNGFDVGHIAITKTALAEVNPLVDLNVPVLQLMEHLQIDVLKTDPKNRSAPPAVAAPAKPTAPPARIVHAGPPGFD